MSELRGTPKASRTVAIVVLVVFFQVLVVAVLGLGAIRQDRDSSRERVRQQADNEARSVVPRVKRDILERISARARLARNVQTGERLEALTRERGSIVREIYLLDPDDAVWWIDGESRLFVPGELRAREIAAMDLRAVEQRRQKVLPRSLDYPKERTLRTRVDHLRAFPYDFESGERRYSFALGYAHDVVELATELYTASRDGAAERRQLVDALLLALEITTLNAGRSDLPAVDLETIPDLEQRIRKGAALLSDEGHAPLRDLVLRWIEYRDRLRDTRLPRSLRLAIGGAAKDDRLVIAEVGAERFGVLHEGNGRFRILRIDTAALFNVAAAEVSARAVELVDTGHDLRILRADQPVAREAQLIRRDRVDGALGSGDRIDTPIELGLVRVGSPVLPEEGRSEFFYWGIIALAAVGFTVGGVVLVRMTAREIRLARLKADFASNLSHELKTPLTSISMFTEMLREGQLADEEDRQEAYQVLDQEASRLQRIVQRMLQVARHQARGVPYARSLGDLNETIERSAERFRRIVADSGFHLEVDLAGEPLTMQLDPAAMDDVITNLLSNAWKYKRGESARVRIRSRRRGRQAEVRVEDDGIGIPPRERKRIFEMFYRSNQLLTQPVQGTGLGLSLVQNIVRAHKGSVRVAPAEGEHGTAFILRFPLSEGRQAQVERAEPMRSELRDGDLGADGSLRPEGVDV